MCKNRLITSQSRGRRECLSANLYGRSKYNFTRLFVTIYLVKVYGCIPIASLRFAHKLAISCKL